MFLNEQMALLYFWLRKRSVPIKTENGERKRVHMNTTN